VCEGPAKLAPGATGSQTGLFRKTERSGRLGIAGAYLECRECELSLAARLGFRDPSRLAALFDHDITAVDLDSRLDGRFLMPWEHDEPARVGSNACVFPDREVQYATAIHAHALTSEAVGRLSVAWTLILDPVVYAPCQGLVLRHTALASIIHSGESFHSSGDALPVLIDELACHRLAAPRGLRIALGCDDDRALNEDVPGVREGLGVAQAGFLG
jgi:hypothetical protein